jgi:hypothetical protein
LSFLTLVIVSLLTRKPEDPEVVAARRLESETA